MPDLPAMFETPPMIVGVDPGGAETGVVARRRNVLHAAILVRKDPDQPFVAYLAEVLDTVADLARTTGAALIAVEDVTPPTGHAEGRPGHLIQTAGLIATAKVVGALLTLAGDDPTAGVALIDPGGHGSQPLPLYPDALVGPLERAGAGRRRHLRSAWDVAAKGALELRAGAVR